MKSVMFISKEGKDRNCHEDELLLNVAIQEKGYTARTLTSIREVAMLRNGHFLSGACIDNVIQK